MVGGITVWLLGTEEPPEDLDSVLPFLALLPPLVIPHTPWEPPKPGLDLVKMNILLVTGPHYLKVPLLLQDQRAEAMDPCPPWPGAPLVELRIERRGQPRTARSPEAHTLPRCAQAQARSLLGWKYDSARLRHLRQAQSPLPGSGTSAFYFSTNTRFEDAQEQKGVRVLLLLYLVLPSPQCHSGSDPKPIPGTFMEQGNQVCRTEPCVHGRRSGGEGALGELIWSRETCTRAP